MTPLMSSIPKPKPKNIYEWMLLNLNDLADAIKEDGKLGGPKSGPLLAQASSHYSGGKFRQKAKSLLKTKLTTMNLAHLLPEDSDGDD